MTARAIAMAAAGGASDPVYIEDVFSVNLYTGAGGQDGAVRVTNDIALVSGGANGVVLHLTGDSFNDSSPVPKTVTPYNYVGAGATGKYGGALSFSQAGDYFKITNALPGGLAGDFTIQCWVNAVTVTEWTPIVETRPNDQTASGVYFYIQSDRSFGVYPFGSAGYVPSGSWTHLAAVRKGSTLRTFINGTLVTQATASPTTYNYPGTDVLINRWVADSPGASATRWMGGYIDDLQISTKALYWENFTPPTAALPLDTLVTGKGGTVWIKERNGGSLSGTSNNIIANTARGMSKILYTNSTTTEITETNFIVPSYDGFTARSANPVNDNNGKFVAWTFGQSPRFYQCLTWVGDGSGTPIAHNLGVKPGVVIVKAADNTGDWWVNLLNSSGTYTLFTLNSAAASTGEIGNHTATVFYPSQVGAGASNTNALGVNYVAHLFAHDTATDGLIRTGTFTTDASGTGTTTLNFGWEVQALILKQVDGNGDWIFMDTMRGMSYGGGRALRPHSTQAEGTFGDASYPIVPTATGVSISGGYLSSSATYAYIAIRRGPMRAPTDATKVFKPVALNGTGTYTTLLRETGFPVDFFLAGVRNQSYAKMLTGSRLQGKDAWLVTSGAFSESYAGDLIDYTFDNQTGVSIYDTNGSWNGTSTSETTILEALRRAPRCFDVVCYKGTGSATSQAHNLTVAPELAIVKRRSNSSSWIVDACPYTNGVLVFNGTSAADTGAYKTYVTDVSATTFSLSNATAVNASNDQYIALLFATCPGVSKVGTYSGTGSAQNVNCGFTAGARFVLIRRVNGADDWLFFDTARGIVSGDKDPYLLLNADNIEDANSNVLQPYAQGFALNGSAQNAIGSTYLFLAIA